MKLALKALVTSFFISNSFCYLRGAESGTQRRELFFASVFRCRNTYSVTLNNPEDPSNCDTNVCGTITFKCSEEYNTNGLTQIQYDISGLAINSTHALHVHENVIGTGGENTCLSAGGHWNPEAHNHGGNLDSVRHIGDLGNILVDPAGSAKGTLLARLPLSGNLGIEGRSVVVHAGKDDLGLGGNDSSRAVGNAGSRPACGNINMD